MKKLLSNMGRGLAYAMLVAAFAASIAQTADARPYGHRGPPPRHHWHRPPPREVYAPAPVVYAPPPVSPGLNLILPLNFR